MCTYIFLEEDGNFVPKSTYQKGNTSIEPKSTSQGIYVCIHIHT